MKIVFVHAPGPKRNVDFLSGKLAAAMQQQTYNLSKEFAIRGYEVYIVRRWSSNRTLEHHDGINFVNIHQPYPFLKRMRREDNLLFHEALLNFIMWFMYSIKVLKVLRDIKPDILNISSLLLGFFIARASKAFKVYITHSHDIYVYNTPYSLLKKFMLRQTLSNCDAIVSLTQSITTYLKSLSYRVDAVIPNALDLNEYVEGNNQRYVLYAGRLVKHKRVIDLLKSYLSIKETTQSELVIIGEGPEMRHLMEWVDLKNIRQSVRFLPFLSQTEYRTALSHCSIFVLPSNLEAFGVVIIEAMACGKPVIARRVHGPTDIITHGYDGFLFNTNNELEKYLELLLSNKELRSKIGRNARKTVLKKYDIRSVVDSYERLFKSFKSKEILS